MYLIVVKEKGETGKPISMAVFSTLDKVADVKAIVVKEKEEDKGKTIGELYALDVYDIGDVDDFNFFQNTTTKVE